MEAAELRLTATPGVPGFSFLSWDTEGNVQTKLNLLRSGAGVPFQVETNGKWVDGKPFVVGGATEGTVELGAAGRAELRWSARTNGAGMVWSLANLGNTGTISRIRITLAFNPRMAATTVLPARWLPPDGFALPAVLSAADFGQLLVRQTGTNTVTGRFTGSRPAGVIDMAFEIPAPPAGQAVTLDFAPWQLPLPKGVDEATWKTIRRGWWNVYEPCVFGEGLAATAEKAPAGVLCNNPISDPVSLSAVWMADHALLIPELAPGVSAETTLRHSVEWWLDRRTDAAGTVVGYAEIRDMLEAPASIMVAAWACAELSGNSEWAAARIAQLERIAEYLASRDVDHDGIVEAPKSGNAGTLHNPERGATGADTINSGHKELFINTLAYRAFCCMADLEKRLKRSDKAERYAGLAGKLRAAFFRTFYSPDTKILSWWISADGQRHDYWAPGVLGGPIAYGLVPEEQAKQMLTLFHAKIKESGFTRLDLGLPFVLTPILRADYIQGVGAVYGEPSREDGSDTFQRYLNGGCAVADQIFWLNAHFRMGMGAKVQPQLAAMVARQGKPVFPNGGSFQNGIVNRAGEGTEMFDWEGKVSGYEGHLGVSFLFLQAAMTRQPEHLNRLFRPMLQGAGR